MSTAPDERRSKIAFKSLTPPALGASHHVQTLGRLLQGTCSLHIIHKQHKKSMNAYGTLRFTTKCLSEKLDKAQHTRTPKLRVEKNVSIQCIAFPENPKI